jgi:hypothetical protein
MSFSIEVTHVLGSRTVTFKTEAPTADSALELFEQGQRILRGEKTHSWLGWPGDPHRKPGEGEAAD